MLDDFDESTEAVEEKEKEEAKLLEQEKKETEVKVEKETTTVNKGFYIKPKEKFDYAKVIVLFILGIVVAIAFLLIAS